MFKLLQPRLPLPGILNFAQARVGVLPEVEEALEVMEQHPIEFSIMIRRGSSSHGAAIHRAAEKGKSYL